MGLFGKTPQRDPKELVRAWSSQLRKEGRQLDRQIREIQREQAKSKTAIKQAAKKNDMDVCKVLAKELVNSNKAVSKIYAAKAQINSVDMTMKNQASMLRVTGALEKSSDVMKIMSNLIKIPEIQKTMQEMSKEMMKAGIIEEMMEDSLDVLETEEDEEAAQEEIDKVLFDLTAGALGKAPEQVTTALPEVGATAEELSEESDSDEEEMRQRLQALRN